ncbi:hypothetical protein VTO42DRAFT_4951 [Malbranchea cinnamomea]
MSRVPCSTQSRAARRGNGVFHRMNRQAHPFTPSGPTSGMAWKVPAMDHMSLVRSPSPCQGPGRTGTVVVCELRSTGALLAMSDIESTSHALDHRVPDGGTPPPPTVSREQFLLSPDRRRVVHSGLETRVAADSVALPLLSCRVVGRQSRGTLGPKQQVPRLA